MKNLSVVRGSAAAFSFVSAIAVVGCSSDSTTVISDTRAQSLEDLPNCTENREGESAVLAENDATYECKNGKWILVSMPTLTVETLDDLSNCTKRIQGDTVKVIAESAIYRCDDEEWVKFRVLTDTLKSTDDLHACVKKREGNLAYVSGEHALYTCEDESWIKTVSYMDTVSSQNNLPNCTSKIEGDSSFVKKENSVYLCVEDKWRYLGVVAESAESLSNCTEKHETEQAFILENYETLICSKGKWRKYDVYSAVDQEKGTSSSSKKEERSSSSSVEDDEIDSSSSLESSSSSEYTIVVPTQRNANITVSSDISSRVSGDDVRFVGRFGLDLVGASTIKGSSFNTSFIGIEYLIGKGADINNMTRVDVTVNSNTIIFPTQNAIDLNSMSSAFVSINLLDPGFAECGVYNLIVTVTASNGDMVFQRTEIIPFEREASVYCRGEYSSSSAVQVKEIPMTSCQVELSTNMNPGLSLSTCTAVPAAGAAIADIIFEKAGSRNNPEITAKSGSGLLFAPIINRELLPYTDDYEVDIWPEDMNPDRSPATAYVSDFKFKTIEGEHLTNMIENSNRIYVAKAPTYNAETGEGFYAFAITDATEGNNGDYTFKVKVYKVP